MHLQSSLRAPPSPPPCRFTLSTSSNLFYFPNRPNCLLPYYAEPISRISLHCGGSRSFSPSAKLTANANEAEEKKTDKLKQNLEALGINADYCTPGQFNLLYCPKCEGGVPIHRSLSLHISKNRSFALWRCFHLQCGWAGKVFADPKKGESLKLENLGDELLAYFAERMISKETLLRNNVMQVVGDRKIIAFPYKQNGQLVGCKYRTVEKKFWQAKDTEKVFYGLDDIAEADKIIIVEGELDKLSVEEAGYYNCVSVPGGAPQTVSLKELPSLEKDTTFQYLWNCKDYFDKASRIILATDGDIPGQALAEELARRLGKERCWRVYWPKKDEVIYFKDANEVLVNLGAEALRDAIDKAELLYQMQKLD
ncbi:primase homolog protein [Phtheirospermum japonicum]|uniref:Primase homolog protein n=1 Tax=Phtheirospermum japonicum TaxID=374723 RepID=A0A830CLF8_9LAMI|nr:primase homolog protein [Phtheirospermum japonicum]